MTDSEILSHPEVRKLVHEGARDGFVSYSQINDLLIDLELDDDFGGCRHFQVDGLAFHQLDRRAPEAAGTQ